MGEAEEKKKAMELMRKIEEKGTQISLDEFKEGIATCVVKYLNDFRIAYEEIQDSNFLSFDSDDMLEAVGNDLYEGVINAALQSIYRCKVNINTLRDVVGNPNKWTFYRDKEGNFFAFASELNDSHKNNGLAELLGNGNKSYLNYFI